MRAYPEGIRISSSNLDPSQFWRVGVQMVALNWQSIDKSMMMQEAMFNGTGGWAQKPETYLSHSTYKDCRSELSTGKSWLSISLLSGQNLPLPPGLESEDKLKSYVKCEVHVEKPEEAKDDRAFRKLGKDSKFKKSIPPAKGIHPQFDEKHSMVFDSLPALVPELSFVRYV
jgi:hypothetical protein